MAKKQSPLRIPEDPMESIIIGHTDHTMDHVLGPQYVLGIQVLDPTMKIVQRSLCSGDIIDIIDFSALNCLFLAINYWLTFLMGALPD